MNITTFGLDIAKNVMQVHWVDGQTGEVRRRALKRSQLVPFFARQAAGRMVLEACGSSHYWGRTLGALGHEVRLIHARHVQAFVRGNKSDAAAANGAHAVNAKDRIGHGPWRNTKGEIIAKDVAQLHSDSNNLRKETALTERGEVVNGRGDQPNKHDILTGSQPDGTAFPSGKDLTCANWTSAGAGAAQVGHHDRVGTGADASARSWNSSHPSAGCSLDDLAKTGGAGLLYCFAAK